jgi:hypothetical protein
MAGASFSLVTERAVTAGCSHHPFDKGLAACLAAAIHSLLIANRNRVFSVWRVRPNAVTMFSGGSFQHPKGEVRE